MWQSNYNFHSGHPRYFASNILILGRILSFKAEKRILSKYEAGLWATKHVPSSLRQVPLQAMKVWFEGEEPSLDPQKWRFCAGI